MLAQYKMCGKFADGTEILISGTTQSECMTKLFIIDENQAHGNLLSCEGVTDENYTDGYLHVHNSV